MEQDLHAIMEEMAVGIKQVIADARTAKNTTYFGFDGALLSQGDRYTYQFDLRVPWDPEENSRVYVELVKGEPLEQQLAARVMSRVGTTLMFSTHEPIPAHLLKKVTLIEDRSWLLERQREVVQRYLDGALEQAPGGYEAKVLHLRPVRYGRKRVKGTLGSFVPNAEQQQALEHGLGSQVTIIVGAAGTGKSAVQALLCTRFLQQGYSILSLSHTNSATDNLFLDQVQFLEESGDADLLRLLREGRIVRAGDPRHISLVQGAYRHLTVSAIAEARTEQAGTRLRLEEAHQALVKNIKDLTHRLQRVEGRWQAERAALEQRRAALEAILAPLEGQERKRLEGIERDLELERQKRAAARQHLDALVMQQANLERHLDRWQGERERRRTLLGMAQQRLVALEQTGAMKRWLAGRHYQQEVQEAQHEAAAGRTGLDQANTSIDALQQDIQRNRGEQETYRVTIEQAESAMRRLQQDSTDTDLTEQMTPHRRSLETVVQRIKEGDAEVAAARAGLEQAQSKQKEIEAQLAALKTQLSTLKAQIVAHAQLVTTTITGAYLNQEVLRRQFDVVVLDEVSMIPVMAALLAAMRATRHVIVAGDPTQLLPILKTECQERERARTMPEAVKWLSRDLLSHLGITIADAIHGRKGCVFLKEQGRMHPRILAPVNHYIYQDMLVSRPETEYAPPIAPLPACPLMLVDSSSSPQSKTGKGRDDQARVNTHHVEVAVALVPQILATLPERSAREDPTVPRIGVLAPYRSQVKRLLTALREAGLAQYVHVGTINTAQALQFDVVILDTVEAPGYAPFAFTYDRVLDDQGAATEATRRLNVGHTRARYKLIYLAHLEQVRRYRPSNPDDQPQRRRLLAEWVEWAAREGSISSWEVLHSPPGERSE
jgi:hypothetical protein